MTNLDSDKVWAAIRKQKDQFNISYSLMDNYERCPRKALLSLVVPRERVEDNQANTVGPSAVHSLFDAWITKANYEPGWMLANAEEYFRKKEEKAPLVIYKKELPEKTRTEWGVSYDRDFQLAKVIKAVQVLEQVATLAKFQEHNIVTEQWITLQLPGQDFYYLKGAVDIYDPVTKTVYDIKVTQDDKYGNPLQLYFYALLLYYNTGIVPLSVAYLYPLVEPAVKQVEFTSQSLQEAAAATREFIKNVNNTEFPVEPASERECFMCNYRRWCPKWGGNFDLGERRWTLERDPTPSSQND